MVSIYYYLVTLPEQVQGLRHFGSAGSESKDLEAAGPRLRVRVKGV